MNPQLRWFQVLMSLLTRQIEVGQPDLPGSSKLPGRLSNRQLISPLVRQLRDREILNELVQSLEAADEAMEAGNVDRALDLLDIEEVEDFLADLCLGEGQDRKPQP